MNNADDAFMCCWGARTQERSAWSKKEAVLAITGPHREAKDCFQSQAEPRRRGNLQNPRQRVSTLNGPKSAKLLVRDEGGKVSGSTGGLSAATTTQGNPTPGGAAPHDWRHYRKYEAAKRAQVRHENARLQFLIDEGVMQYTATGTASQSIKTLREGHRLDLCAAGDDGLQNKTFGHRRQSDWLTALKEQRDVPVNVFSHTDPRLFYKVPEFSAATQPSG